MFVLVWFVFGSGWFCVCSSVFGGLFRFVVACDFCAFCLVVGFDLSVVWCLF